MTVTSSKNNIHEGFQFPRLSAEQCRRIHEACLDILERIGVQLELQDAVELLRKAGAKVLDGNHVRIPSSLVEKALSTAPKCVTLYDRQGDPAIEVTGHRCFYGPGSDCLNILDHRSGKRRDPVLQDVVEGTVLCDYLENIDFVMSMVLPKDVDQTFADRNQMEAMLTYTTKPIIYVTYELGGCLDAVAMAEAVVGGAEKLRQKPISACYINAVSGLLHNKEALEKLLFLSSKNLPCLYLPSSTAAVTSPVTPAGNVAMDYAGVLAGLVLSQLNQEGAPVIVTGMPPGGTFDMRTMITSYCEPERTITQAMSHYFGLPMFSIAGASEAKTVDSQSAAEAALSLVVESLAGGNMIHDLGYMESGLTYSFIQLVLCDESVSWIKSFLKAFEVSDETLALDVIAEAGPAGQYLNTEHTFKHYKERWYPKYFERMNYETWLHKGGKNFTERVSKKIDTVLAEHKPDPLPAEVKKQLRRIVENAK
ncbi:MAG: trimethylamine methyltransferase family protein [Candidatus Aminicenantes bacterium]|nr:trimethylamine methyltransferase family protein [Candidatus Aminicenantes bacterium]